MNPNFFIPCNSYIGFIKEGFGEIAAFSSRVILCSGCLAWQVFDHQVLLGVEKKKIIVGIIFPCGILSVLHLHECIISKLLAFSLAHPSCSSLSSAAFSSIISGFKSRKAALSWALGRSKAFS